MAVERKCFFVSANVRGGGTRDEALRTSVLGGYCSEGLRCGPDGCKSDTLLLHDDGLLLCCDLTNRKEGQ